MHVNLVFTRMPATGAFGDSGVLLCPLLYVDVCRAQLIPFDDFTEGL